VQFLPDGKLQYEMTADKVEHLKASEVTLVTTPDLHMYRGTEYPGMQSTRRVNPDGTEVE
jgi:lipopolysaccharide export system protein LptC